MDKPLTFCEACAQLGITEDDNDGNENEEDLIEEEDSLWEQ